MHLTADGQPSPSSAAGDGVGDAETGATSQGRNLGVGQRTTKNAPKTKQRVRDRQHRHSHQRTMTTPQALFVNFHSELTSLRETTKECLQYFYYDRERRCAEIEKMESRSAYLRRIIDFKRSDLSSNNKASVGLSFINNTASRADESASIGLDALEDDGTEYTSKSTTPPKNRAENSHAVVDAARRDREGGGWAHHLSFMDGVNDGMPTRWRTRVQERSKQEKQSEENNKWMTIPFQDDAEDTLQDRIVGRKSEILALENGVILADQEISSLRGDISVLQGDLRKAQRKFERERMDILDKIKKVEFNNENLDRMLIETEVFLEEKNISTDILAEELKRVRKDLVNIQKERDLRKSERRRKDSIMMNKFATVVERRRDADEANLKGEQTQQQQQEPLCNNLDSNGHHLQTGPPDEYGDRSGGSSVHGLHECNDSHDLKLSPSQISIRTGISSVTHDNCTYFDVLEQLERHKELHG